MLTYAAIPAGEDREKLLHRAASESASFHTERLQAGEVLKHQPKLCEVVLCVFRAAAKVQLEDVRVQLH